MRKLPIDQDAGGKYVLRPYKRDLDRLGEARDFALAVQDVANRLSMSEIANQALSMRVAADKMLALLDPEPEPTGPADDGSNPMEEQ